MFISSTKYKRTDRDWTPTYICDKCGRKISTYRPMRLVVEEYLQKPYFRHYPVDNLDLCNRCYEVFNKWIHTKPKKKEEVQKCTEE